VKVESPAALPPRPPSEVEWEELLMRVELMTRAFRNVMEDLDLQGVSRELGEMVAREEAVARWLESRALGEETKAADSPPLAPELLADRFVSLRARNFAMVQRRGLEVWEWSGGFAGGEVVTAYQLLRWLVGQDVAALAALRSPGRGEARAC
jgi:hypothetical protein